jgi:hypothetical protein
VLRTAPAKKFVNSENEISESGWIVSIDANTSSTDTPCSAEHPASDQQSRRNLRPVARTDHAVDNIFELLMISQNLDQLSLSQRAITIGVRV